jgi:hypothetical protein
MIKKIILSVLILSSGFSLLYAQDETPVHFCSGGLFYDQDYTLEQAGFKKLNEDRNYTMGFGFYYSADCLNKWIIYRPHDWLFKKLHSKISGNVISLYSIMLANGSFTPDSLPATYPILNDRPYASLTYIQTNASYLNADKNRTYTISLSAGVLGSDISKAVQTYIHTHMNDNDTHDPRTPRGWGNQISNGGASTVLIGYQEDYLLTTKPIKDNKTRRIGGEWKAAWKLNAGWYNMASGEISYRFGLIDTRNWTYMTNPLGNSNKLQQRFVKATGDVPGKGEIYLFSTLRTDLVGYNVLLSGQGGADDVTIPNKWVRHGILDGTAGICISPVINHLVNIDLKGKFNFRSPEFEAPGRKPRWHYWGGLELLVTVLH